MSPGIISLVIFAAILHASWNALAKKSSEPLFGIGSFRLVCAAMALCCIPFVELPARESWWALVLSTLVHSAYYFTAASSLKTADLSQVYPLYRGISPLLVAALSAWFANEWLNGIQWLAIVIITTGLLSIAWHPDIRGRLSRQALYWGLTTSVLIATYTVVDGMGVRVAGNPLSYIFWLFALEAIPIGAYLFLLKRREFYTYLVENYKTSIAGGVASAVAYGLVIYAMSLGAIALVSSLRESSVIFAAIIGSLFLGEPFGRRRILASCLVVIGVIVIRLAA